MGARQFLVAVSLTLSCAPESVVLDPQSPSPTSTSAPDRPANSAVGVLGATGAAGATSSPSTGESQSQVATAAPAQAPTAEPPEIPTGMLLVPGGTFTMGANDVGEEDERPAHAVTVASFLLDETEVTNAAYLECVNAKKCGAPAVPNDSPLVNGHAREFRLPRHPVVGVSWFDAQSYCAFRGQRLPTEAEWERASRGDDARVYVWGNDPPDPARHGVFGGRLTTADVGSFPAGRGPYGHLDLAGNVWEWTADEYDPFAYRRPTADRGIPASCDQIKETQDLLRAQHKQGFTGKNPIPFECERVLRGGAYNYAVRGLRASNRVHHPAWFRIAVAGLRCARDLYPR